jgi:3-deoxy-manno-octulosonate cytidylyltransferase (CMP-KDO synthetase)
MADGEQSLFNVVIPARFGSSRLPGKPLLKIAGKTMIQRVWENSGRAGAENVVVATDNQRIVDEVEGFGGMALMTRDTHRSGTDRISEVVGLLGWPDDTIIVNVQGDEPLLTPELILLAADALHTDARAGIATLATPIKEVSQLLSPHVVKVVFDEQRMALYFSRAPIPWVRDAFGDDVRDLERLPDGFLFYRHIGLYAYRVGSLLSMAGAGPSGLEMAESLEQLRALSYGIGIRVCVIEKAPGHGVDTPEDLMRVEALLLGDCD